MTTTDVATDATSTSTSTSTSTGTGAGIASTVEPSIEAAGEAAEAHVRVPGTVRAAQVLFLVPLGAFQLVASVVFSITMGLHGAEYLVAAWAILMAAAGVFTGLGLGRGDDRVIRLASGLLAAQAAFGLVKLTVYHESASFVFFAFTVACAVLLILPASRRYLRVRGGSTTW